MSARHLVPEKLFFTSGVGEHADHLASFGMALRDAGIEHLNLVTVSSIVPPGCRIISKAEGIPELESGEIAFVVLSRNATDELDMLISASIGCALPRDADRFGYLAEYHTSGKNKDDTLEYACNLAAEMCTTLYDDGATKRTGIARDAVSGQGWTTGICAAVFLMPEM
uniref:Pyruvoyl-dependent arginine decarboxylase n=1 Tax=Candidatus Methanogaster sp. ANME-2c ERB4 TaxID=2759911 RepID=A0A7G9Y3G5_9EURY|nr:pyruvoyl-dependent arginine decarboxylase [Methanosarcinales archaeon ANME-2c ERB4]